MTPVSEFFFRVLFMMLAISVYAVICFALYVLSWIGLWPVSLWFGILLSIWIWLVIRS